MTILMSLVIKYIREKLSPLINNWKVDQESSYPCAKAKSRLVRRIASQRLSFLKIPPCKLPWNSNDSNIGPDITKVKKTIAPSWVWSNLIKSLSFELPNFKTFPIIDSMKVDSIVKPKEISRFFILNLTDQIGVPLTFL